MPEVGRILDQMQRAWKGGAWHGPSVREVLKAVEPEQAYARPLAGAHSIAEIALHIGTWEDVVRRRLGGEVVVGLPDAQDWPPVTGQAAADWQALRRRLEDVHSRLEQTVAELPEERLAEPVAGKDYDVYVLLHGCVQHVLYHAGQIALLHKGSGGVR